MVSSVAFRFYMGAQSPLDVQPFTERQGAQSSARRTVRTGQKSARNGVRALPKQSRIMMSEKFRVFT